MSRGRGRPRRGQELKLEQILKVALSLLDTDQRRLTMRALAEQLGVTPMSLYHHLKGRTSLLLALAEQVYGQVLVQAEDLCSLMMAYYDAVGRHPQLTLALFATPGAVSGVTWHISERVTQLLQGRVAEPLLWRDILIDHAHGSGLALAAAAADPLRTATLRGEYRRALEQLLATR